MRLILALAVAISSASLVVAEERDIEIPLKSIWAHEMPGTHDIHELEGKSDSENSLMAVIGRALKARPKVGQAFAVEGKGLEALKAAFAVITKQRPIAKSLSGEVSVAFFTQYSPYYVHLANVTRKGKTVRIEYELLPHRTLNRTLHFALIPLGSLPAGDFKVEIAAKPMAKEFIQDGFKEVEDEAKELIVSSSFKFHVD